MPFEELTPRQRKIYSLIERFIEKRGYPPTLQELSDELNINPNGVRDHLLSMHKKKVLRYIPNISRGIELLHRKPTGIPIYGSAPAGNPFLSQENIVDTFEVRKYISATEGVFGIEVRGDSMKGAQLNTGDLLFVDPRVEPRNGHIVVALVNGAPTIKRFHKDGSTIELRAENKKYPAITVDKSDDNFQIFGVVVGMIRALDKKKIDSIVDEYRSFSKAS
jgi:repressor LexA